MGRRKENKPFRFSAMQTFGPWRLEQRIGSGGNGEVWRARHENLGIAAIKLLSLRDGDRFIRFKSEVQAMERLYDVAGVVPLLDKGIPDKLSDGTPWIVMPLAGRIFDHLVPSDYVQNVKYFAELALTISEIHERNISHRDIKPDDLLFLGGRVCLSDFGLVKFPDREAITKVRRDVGPKFTMAPEMRRSAYRSDGKMADVFSFAKTLWIVLTGETFGFDGQYLPSSSVGLGNFLSGMYTNSLDQLLGECTDNEPARRPTMIEVSRRLSEWVDLAEDFHRRNLREWIELEKTMFPAGLPLRAVWTDLDTICSVINTFSSVNSLMHMFYPTCGGNDITGAARAGEVGLIALHIGGRPRDILKPKKLTFESFGCDSQWNYFRLEAEIIPPTGIEGAICVGENREWLTEYEDGIYISVDHWEDDDYYGEPLPPYSRRVARYLRGSFVFFGKRSYYNRILESYDAIHERYDENGFRNLIAGLAMRSNSAEIPAELELI